MSTYYYIGCAKCEVCVSLVGRWAGERWELMAGAGFHVPEFFSEHTDHLDRLVCFSEHDSRCDTWLRPDLDDAT